MSPESLVSAELRVPSCGHWVPRCEAQLLKRIHLTHILNDELFSFNVLLGKEPPGMHPAAPKAQILCAPLHSTGPLVVEGSATAETYPSRQAMHQRHQTCETCMDLHDALQHAMPRPLKRRGSGCNICRTQTSRVQTYVMKTYAVPIAAGIGVD